MESFKRHLAATGFSGLIDEIHKAATKAGAPFLERELSPAAAEAHWSYAYEALVRLATLERAVASAKSEAGGADGMAALMGLKTERDTLRRAIKMGTIWEGPGS